MKEPAYKEQAVCAFAQVMNRWLTGADVPPGAIETRDIVGQAE